MDMPDWIRRLFRRGEPDPARPLRIDGTPPAPLTPEPDVAETAALALLETMAGIGGGQEGPAEGTADYYRRLADRIRLAHGEAELRTKRFLAWCEAELQRDDIPQEGKGSLAQMEFELYKRIDTVERVGGDLRRRWQHCLATAIVRRLAGDGGGS